MLSRLKAWFRRNRELPTAKEDSGAIRLSGAEDEKEFLATHPCECGGAWTPGAHTSLTAEGGIWRYSRAVQCSVCGLQNHFTFEAPLPEEETGGQQVEDSPRELHYMFVHRMLPRWFFEGPEEFIHSITQPSGLRRLREIWKNVDDELVAQGDVTIPGDELTVEEVDVNGCEAALVRFPQPMAYTEAYFACLVTLESPEEARFYVLERTEVSSELDDSDGNDAAGQWGMLCEWLEGGRRRNHQTVIAPSAEQFLKQVRQQLQEEAKRREASASPVMVPTWDFADGEEYSDAVLENQPFRLHPCLFAFHLLPRAVFDQSGPISVNVGMEGVSQVIGGLWQRAANACVSTGQSPLPTDQAPSVEVLGSGDDSYFLVRMPEALSPPEPFLIAIPRTSGFARIFLLEYAGLQKPALLASINAEGAHGIHGMSGGVDDAALMNAISAVNGQEQLRSAGNVLTHLIHYAQIAKAAEQFSR